MNEKQINIAMQVTLAGVAIPQGVWKGFAPSGLAEDAQYAVWSPLNTDDIKDADGVVWRVDIEINCWGPAPDESELIDYSNSLVTALDDNLESNLPDGATVIDIDEDPVLTSNVDNRFAQANREIQMVIEE